MFVRKNLIIFAILTGIVIGLSLIGSNDTELNDRNPKSNHTNFSEEFFIDQNLIPESAIPQSATSENHNNIEKILNEKLSNYSALGYFPQIYESSLQATYYALYILETIGKLDTINQSAMTEYIISHYNSSTHVFMDKYAFRYLDTDFNKEYFPLTSVLEINCYAILSLAILNKLYLIDVQASIDFIWSCYDAPNGFIGRPYGSSPTGIFQTSSMDNTYYAIITLDLLADWNSYDTQKDSLVVYINSLQTGSGGFLNDFDLDFAFLDTFLLDPNLISAYYCIKSLSIFGLESSIMTDDFHLYLEGLYNSTDYFFDMSGLSLPYNHYDILATAFGLQLSDLTPNIDDEYFLDPVNRTGVINFLINNRNSMGGWDSSRQYGYHELIDLFQIVRALKEANAISQLSQNDKDELENAISNYYQRYGYSLLSNDYVSLELYNAITSSFSLYDRVADLDLQGLYNIIEKSCYYQSSLGYYYFTSSSNMPYNVEILNKVIKFRSKPIEYYTSSQRVNIEEIGTIKDHKSTYMALNSLEKLYKLDDFNMQFNLTKIVNSIIDSQFLEQGYDNYGGFLPTQSLSLASASIQDSDIFYEYSYYAIKSLELLSNILGLGEINNLDFEQNSLYVYIMNSFIDDGTFVYFNPQYTNDFNTILENTYFMIYILKAIDMYNLDNQKIKNFVIANLDYKNIKNVYYSYKISEILNLDIDFDAISVYNLVQHIYSPDLQEFFLDEDKEEIEQEALLWICEMAKNDKLRIDIQYSDRIKLGTHNSISVSLYNMILKDFGPHVIVKYESNQIGTKVFDKMPDNTFHKYIGVPVNPGYYPQVNGSISVYKGLTLIKDRNISFQTVYDFNYTDRIIKKDNFIQIEYDVSYCFSLGYEPAYDTRIYATILKNNLYKEIENFTRKDYFEYSKFTLYFYYPDDSEYSFNITLVDNFHPEGLYLSNHTRSPSLLNDDDGDDDEDDDEILLVDLTNNVDWLLLFIVAFSVFTLSLIIKAGFKKMNKEGKNRENSAEKIESNSKETKKISNKSDVFQLLFNDQERQTDLADTSDSHGVNGEQKTKIQPIKHRDKLKSRPQITDKLELISNYLKPNKKILFWTTLGIIILLILYIFGLILIVPFFFGGVIAIIVGIIFRGKMGRKMLVIGGIFIGFVIVIILLQNVKIALDVFFSGIWGEFFGN